jgi:peptidoglycan/LPS O-acetylase OafA/YrhL
VQAITSIGPAAGSGRGGVTYGEMPKTAGTTSRLAWLDALRGFAALCVVFDHGSTLLLLPARDFLYQWFNFGEYGVFVFFLVSGYIVPASLERKGSLRAFWTSRGFRLYPMYAAAIVLAAIAYWNRFGTIRGAEHHPLTSVTSWLLMLPNLLTGPNVPNVTWTLSYEMVFYLLLAALFSWRIHARSSSYALTFAVGAVALGGVLPMAALTRWAQHYGHGPFWLNVTADALIIAGIVLAVTDKRWPARLGGALAALTALVLVSVNQGSPYPWSGYEILALMFTGTVIYRAEQGQLNRLVAAGTVFAVLALTTAAGLWHGARMGHQWQVQWATSILLAAATFGLGMAARNRKVPRAAAWLGVISYSVYLLHPLVFDAYRDVPALHRLDHSTEPVQAGVFVALAVVIIAVSALTYYTIEKPMQRLGHRLARRAPGYTAGVAASASSAAVTSDAAAAGDGTDGAAATRSTSSNSAVAGGSGGSP